MGAADHFSRQFLGFARQHLSSQGICFSPALLGLKLRMVYTVFSCKWIRDEGQQPAFKSLVCVLRGGV